MQKILYILYSSFTRILNNQILRRGSRLLNDFATEKEHYIWNSFPSEWMYMIFSPSFNFNNSVYIYIYINIYTHTYICSYVRIDILFEKKFLCSEGNFVRITFHPVTPIFVGTCGLLPVSGEKGYDIHEPEVKYFYKGEVFESWFGLGKCFS
jgi:hypothetical protein